MFKKLQEKRFQINLEKLKSKGDPRELFRIPYVSSQLGTREYHYFGELVFSDKAIAFLLIERFRLLTYDHPPILILYLFFIFVGSVILESQGVWGKIIGGGIGAIIAGIIHDQLRKRNRKKIRREIARMIHEGRKPQMEDILTFFWRENVTALPLTRGKISLERAGQKPIEFSLHDKPGIESLEQKLAGYLKSPQEGIP